MAEDDGESRDVCNHPRVEIDAWGQRLRGCIECNQWMNFDGQWLRLPEQDIAALRGLAWRRSNSLDSGPPRSMRYETKRALDRSRRRYRTLSCYINRRDACGQA
jgi:hypothetical protein